MTIYRFYFLAILALTSINSLDSQVQPEFELPIIVEDAIGNMDTFWFGYDDSARYDTLNAQLGERLENAPLDSVLDIRGFHAGDKEDKSYPSKTIIAHIEDGFCPFTEVVYFFIYAKHYPITIKYDSEIFPKACHDFRSEILLWNDLFLSAGGPWSSSDEYICMSFQDGVMHNKEFSESEITIRDSFLLNNGAKELAYGYAITLLGFNECKLLVNDENFYSEQFHVIQNPVIDYIRLDGVENSSKKLKYSIISMNGESVKVGLIQDSRIKINDLPKGVYLLRIEDHNGKASTNKVIVKG